MVGQVVVSFLWLLDVRARGTHVDALSLGEGSRLRLLAQPLRVLLADPHSTEQAAVRTKVAEPTPSLTQLLTNHDPARNSPAGREHAAGRVGDADEREQGGREEQAGDRECEALVPGVEGGREGARLAGLGGHARDEGGNEDEREAVQGQLEGQRGLAWHGEGSRNAA